MPNAHQRAASSPSWSISSHRITGTSSARRKVSPFGRLNQCGSASSSGATVGGRPRRGSGRVGLVVGGGRAPRRRPGPRPGSAPGSATRPPAVATSTWRRGRPRRRRRPRGDGAADGQVDGLPVGVDELDLAVGVGRLAVGAAHGQLAAPSSSTRWSSTVTSRWRPTKRARGLVGEPLLELATRSTRSARGPRGPGPASSADGVPSSG
jgi:hypothetical protein